MRRAQKYRAYPNRETEEKLREWLRLCCDLWNAAVFQRRDCYERCGWGKGIMRKRISPQRQNKLSPDREAKRQERGIYTTSGLCKAEQDAQLTLLKKECPEFNISGGSQVLKNVLDRLDKAYQAFFKRPGPTGPPSFHKYRNYRSFTFPNASGWRVDGNAIITPCGRLKLRPLLTLRPTQGEIKTVTVEESKTGKWFVVFSCDGIEPDIKPPCNTSIGIDVGTMMFAMDSDGKRTPRGEFLESHLRQIRILQRRAARQRTAAKREGRQGSKRLDRTYDEIRSVFEKITNRRLDFICKLAKYYTDNYDEINIENLDIIGLIQASKGWPKMSQEWREKRKEEGKKLKRRPAIARLRMLDAGWGIFFTRLEQKCEFTGRTLNKKPTPYTTMTCSQCGSVQGVPEIARMYDCKTCGKRIHRKLNAARNIAGITTGWENGDMGGIAALINQIRYDLYKEMQHEC